MSHDVTSQEEHLELLHSKITTEIKKSIENQDNIFSFRGNTLTFDCVKITEQVYKELDKKNLRLTDLLKGNENKFDTFGAHPPDDKNLDAGITEIWTTLLNQLEKMPGERLEKLLKTQAELGEDAMNIFAFCRKKQPFKGQTGYLQPVSTGKTAVGTKKMHAHFCRINLTTDGKVFENLKQAILRDYKKRVKDETDLRDIEESVEDLFTRKESSAFIELQKLINEESLGLIKREAEISYLEYLLKNAKEREIPHESLKKLERIVNNIRAIEKYISSDARSDSDCLYQITDEHQCDLRDLLDTADAVSALPIIGRIDGNIEEKTSSDRNRVFVFGIRFKANGKVTHPEPLFSSLNGNETVYAYHLKKAREILETAKKYNLGTIKEPSEEIDQKLNLLGYAIRTIFVYLMVFSRKENKEQLWQTLAEKLHDARENEALDKLLTTVGKMLDNQHDIEKDMITPALDTLKEVLESKETCRYGEFSRYLLLSRQLLNEDSQNAVVTGNIFTAELHRENKINLKKCLRYIQIAPHSDDKTLHTIQLTISFHDVFFHADTKQRRKISVTTDPKSLKFLPVIVKINYKLPNETEPLISEKLKNTVNTATFQVIMGTCQAKEGLKSTSETDEKHRLGFFVCKTVTAIIFQLVLAVLCFKLSKQKDVYISVLRIHGDKNDKTEEYFDAVCKAVTFLLNENYLLGIQGIQNKAAGLEFRIFNARSSLYSSLPKYFTCEEFTPAFNLFAIVVVSARRAETQAKPRQDNWLNLTGKIILFEQVENNTTKVSSCLLTFAENCLSLSIYEGTQKLIDTVRDLYEKLGVKHVLYISKAPFTNNLHLTQTDNPQKLHFASEDILQKMRAGYSDFNIYPVFFESYPAKVFEGKSNALYIDDVSAIQEHVQMDRDSNSRIITFLNIASGMTVRRKDDNAKSRFFNSVMSYSTLDNIYKDVVLNNEVIGQQILRESSVRATLIYFICLLHTAAFESAFETEEIRTTKEKFKLNPYKDIFEEENVNATNTFPLFKWKLKFNLFAFMTKIQRIINLLESRHANEDK